MAIFHFKIHPIKRSADQKATAAAAYRAGERIHDERTGTVHDHSRRTDVTHKEIFVPSHLDASQVQWAQDRASLWNTAERAEPRRDSRVAREFQVSLPPELEPQQRVALARNFARELSDRYGVAIDLAVHDPKPGGDPRNFHAHLLATTREVTPEGLGQKTGLEMSNVKRAALGLSDHSEEYSALRERWAALTNEALREAKIEARVDHRTLAAQGIDRQPVVHVPMEFYRWKGVDSETLARIREDYRARIAARLERSKQTEQSRQTEQQSHQTEQQPHQTEQQPHQTEQQSHQTEQQSHPSAQKDIDPRNMEEIRRRAVQSWLEMRSKGVDNTQPQTHQERSQDRSQGRENER
jgi:ATP-dependent exoDNAse (exonuclease V) alpha subunit